MRAHEILEVPPTATIDQAKRAYRQLARRYHPDRGGDVQQFIRVRRAYEALLERAQSAPVDECFYWTTSPQFGRCDCPTAPTPNAEPPPEVELRWDWLQGAHPSRCRVRPRGLPRGIPSLLGAIAWGLESRWLPRSKVLRELLIAGLLTVGCALLVTVHSLAAGAGVLLAARGFVLFLGVLSVPALLAVLAGASGRCSGQGIYRTVVLVMTVCAMLANPGWLLMMP